MKSHFFILCCLSNMLSLYVSSLAREAGRRSTRVNPNIEVAGMLNLNKVDLLAADHTKRLSAHNSGGYSLGIGLTLFKARQNGGMFSISAGYKCNYENFAIRHNAEEKEVQYKKAISTFYFRPELSFQYRIAAESYIHFGCYIEPNFVATQTMPQYHLEYNRSALSSFNTLTTTTYYHWARNKELYNDLLLLLPVPLAGISAGCTQFRSGGLMKMTKFRLFFEIDPEMAIDRNPHAASYNRSAATIKHYEDNGTKRNAISTDYYIDKMMRLGLSIAVGI